jgi:cell division protein FtsI/penicillin-binding protein 2
MKEISWRDFQSEYIVKKKLFLKKAIMGFGALILLITGIYLFSNQIANGNDSLHKASQENPTHSIPPTPAIPTQLLKTQLTQLINDTDFIHTDKNIFFIETPDEHYKITTSIDTYLQEYLLSLLDRLKGLTRGKPQRIAFVVMEADTGKIIAMTGFDLQNPDANPCIESDYPAASIFKIVTAAAAIETLGYTPQTQLFFNGNKYTLYKRQLKDVKNKYTYKISFSRAFAESVNPIFGKIGKNYLGKEKLDFYADAFGFNQVVQSELPFVSGNFETNGTDYHLAELGCGFNTNTMISPIFGAMLISAVVNSGKVTLPSIVEHVTNFDGELIYKYKKAIYKTAISPQTAATMMQLMQKTVSKGTARKSFRGFSRDKVLSKLVIGGKTGSLYNKKHTIKYDWFTGFGKDKTTNKKIVLSIVVGHGKYIGTKSTAYAKMILKQHFKNNVTATTKL